MNLDVILGILLPFAGTTFGAAMVFFMRKEMNEKLQKGLLGFASGVMIAASVWSLLIPAIEMAEEGGQIAWIPAAAGFLLGIGFLLLLDTVTPHQHFQESEPEGLQASLRKTTMLMLAVTLHNIPEGMAVGVTFAGVLSDNVLITMTGAFVLSAGIAIQNFPEGAIISMPLRAQGITKRRAFVYGTLSGIVEPIAAFLTIWADGACSSASAIFSLFCGRRYDLCCSGRVDSGGTKRKTYQCRNNRCCSRVHTDDDSGCGAGIEKSRGSDVCIPSAFYL